MKIFIPLGIPFIIILVVLWLSVVDYNSRRRDLVLNMWTDMEMNIIKEAARATKEWFVFRMKDKTASIDRIEQEVFKLFIEPIKLLKNGDAFIYNKKYVIFDKSEDFPEIYKNKTIAQIFEIQKEQGASHYEDLVNGVLKATEGTGWYIWLPDKGREFVAWTSFGILDDTWTIGLSTPEPEILEYFELEKDFERELLGVGLINFLLIGIYILVLLQQKQENTKTSELNMVNLSLAKEVNEHRKTEMELLKLNETLEKRIKEEVQKNREKDGLMLIQSRQASMGEMIGHIAHQWSQPITALSLMIENFKGAYDNNKLTRDFLYKRVEMGLEILANMSQTMTDFRNFFKPDKQKSEFKIRHSIDKCIMLVTESYKTHSVKLELSDECDKAVVVGFFNEFSQVVLNILNNAKDVITEKKMKNGLVRIRLFCEDDSAVITITDNGGGIPEEILPNIFEPYFTTKEKGMGIGLYMSRVIIEKNMGGSISARNIDGGAEFRIEVKI